MLRQDENVEAFGFDADELRESQNGRGESLLHKEGKRRRDREDYDRQKLAIKRQNRAARVPEAKKAVKEDLKKKRQAKLDEYSSASTVANLCSGITECCSGRCLAVNSFSIFYFEFGSHNGKVILKTLYFYFDFDRSAETGLCKGARLAEITGWQKSRGQTWQHRRRAQV